MRYYETVIVNQTRMPLFGQHFDYKQKKGHYNKSKRFNNKYLPLFTIDGCNTNRIHVSPNYKNKINTCYEFGLYRVMRHGVTTYLDENIMSVQTSGKYKSYNLKIRF